VGKWVTKETDSLDRPKLVFSKRTRVLGWILFIALFVASIPVCLWLQADSDAKYAEANATFIIDVKVEAIRHEVRKSDSGWSTDDHFFMVVGGKEYEIEEEMSHILHSGIVVHAEIFKQRNEAKSVSVLK
jgi:hypothetical protein